MMVIFMVIIVMFCVFVVWCLGVNIGFGFKFLLKLNGWDGDGVLLFLCGVDVDVGKVNLLLLCVVLVCVLGVVLLCWGIVCGCLRIKVNFCASFFELDELDATWLLIIG